MSDQNALHTFSPSESAHIVGITATSVRRWIEYHSKFFSDTAKPGDHGNRRLTWADIETLKRIKGMRDQGLSVETINALLGDQNVDQKLDITPVDSAVNVPVTAVTPSVGLPAESLDRYITRDEIERLVSSNRMGFISGLALGFIGAGIMFLILVVLISIYAK